MLANGEVVGRIYKANAALGGSPWMMKNWTGLRVRLPAMTDVATADDGLPATKVGPWTLEKHERLFEVRGYYP